ncbi:MAG: hypothetical protein KAS59_04590 [Alphaproteobacteria bacterium]|nr:hypothetical protein [Alphaproteobacteria bacterium]
MGMGMERYFKEVFNGGSEPTLTSQAWEAINPKDRLDAVNEILKQGTPDQKILEKVAMGNYDQGDRLHDRYWKVRKAAVGGLDKIDALEAVIKQDGHFQVIDAAEDRLKALFDTAPVPPQGPTM